MTYTTEKLSQQQIVALGKLGTATIHEAQGAIGAIDSAIKPLARNMKMAGPALTLQMRPGDNLMIHYALLHAKAGQVLVINCDGFTGAGIWGDVLTAQAQKIGLAGLVVNGAVRDSEAMIDAGFPVFTRGVCIRGTEKKQPGTLDAPLYINDCLISPGDIIVGDADGLVVIKKEDLDDVIRLSELREEKERIFKEKIMAGATTAELMELASVFSAAGLKNPL